MTQELLDKQSRLDAFIDNNMKEDLSSKERLTNTILAAIVEISELANEIRCFKHWSKKESSHKDILLEEYVDVLHFFLSIGNQLNFSAQDIINMYNKKYEINILRQKENY